jgi:hypothetical protein
MAIDYITYGPPTIPVANRVATLVDVVNNILYVADPGRGRWVQISGGGGTGTFADAEIPTGNIDGVNKTFNLGNSPTPSDSLELFLNGILQSPTQDYTLSGFVITMNSAPTIGSFLIAWYRF